MLHAIHGNTASSTEEQMKILAEMMAEQRKMMADMLETAKKWPTNAREQTGLDSTACAGATPKLTHLVLKPCGSHTGPEKYTIGGCEETMEWYDAPSGMDTVGAAEWMGKFRWA